MSLEPSDIMHGVDGRVTVREYIENLLDEQDIEKRDGIVEEVCEVLSEYKGTGSWRWRMSELARGALYLVLKRRGIPRDASDLAREDEHRNVIYRRWKDIARRVGEPIEPFTAEEWFPRVREVIDENLVDLDKDIVEEAEDTYKELKEVNNFGAACGQSPRSFVTTVFYHVLKHRGYDISLSDMVWATGVSKHTLKDNLEKIEEVLR